MSIELMRENEELRRRVDDLSRRLAEATGKPVAEVVYDAQGPAALVVRPDAKLMALAEQPGPGLIERLVAPAPLRCCHCGASEVHRLIPPLCEPCIAEWGQVA